MFLLVLLLLAPAGQALEIQPGSVGDLPLLQPDEETRLSIDVTVDCQGPADALPGERHLVHNIETGHAGLVASGQTHHRLPDDLCTAAGADRWEGDIPFKLVGSMDVPGETPIDVEHIFSIDGAEAANETTITQVVMAWQDRFTATQEETHKRGGPQKQLEYGITITNHGNAPTMFRFELVGTPQTQGHVVVPNELFLGSAAMGDAKTTATTMIVYSTPFENGKNHANESFTIRVVPESTKDAELEGEGHELTFTAETRGVYVPSPFMLLPLALLAAAAWVRRR